jgi:hypothetical protein
MIDPCRDNIRGECRHFYLTRLIEPRLSAQQVPVRDVRFDGHLLQADLERYACEIKDTERLPAEFGRMPLHLYRREIKEILADASGSGCFLAIIRPKHALEPQLVAIKKRVAAVAGNAKSTRDRERNYPVYLRLLDARRGRPQASWNEIAKLLGSEKRAGMERQAARDLYKQSVARQKIMINSPQIA